MPCAEVAAGAHASPLARKVPVGLRMQRSDEEFFTFVSEAGSNLVETIALPLAATLRVRDRRGRSVTPRCRSRQCSHAIVGWGIALFEYLLQVPANRIGCAQLSLAQLKILQELITLGVFGPFAVFYMRQPLKWDYLRAALCIVGRCTSCSAAGQGTSRTSVAPESFRARPDFGSRSGRQGFLASLGMTARGKDFQCRNGGRG